MPAWAGYVHCPQALADGPLGHGGGTSTAGRRPHLRQRLRPRVRPHLLTRAFLPAPCQRRRGGSGSGGRPALGPRSSLVNLLRSAPWSTLPKTACAEQCAPRAVHCASPPGRPTLLHVPPPSWIAAVHARLASRRAHAGGCVRSAAPCLPAACPPSCRPRHPHRDGDDARRLNAPPSVAAVDLAALSGDHRVCPPSCSAVGKPSASRRRLGRERLLGLSDHDAAARPASAPSSAILKSEEYTPNPRVVLYIRTPNPRNGDIYIRTQNPTVAI